MFLEIGVPEKQNPWKTHVTHVHSWASFISKVAGFMPGALPKMKSLTGVLQGIH